jgi:hypothetical protein
MTTILMRAKLMTIMLVLIAPLGAFGGVPANGKVPGEDTTWQTRFPSSKADATERLGVYTGTFRGDSNWKVQLEIYIDPTFAPNQKAVLHKASKYLMKELFAGRVWNCAELWGPDSLPAANVGDFQDYLYNQLRTEEKLRTLYITRFWYKDTTIRGRANLGGLDRGMNLPRRSTYYAKTGHFWITVNSYNIGNDVPGATTSPKYWAGVIVHEMLHNLGLVHPNFERHGRRTDFIYAFGNCM